MAPPPLLLGFPRLFEDPENRGPTAAFHEAKEPHVATASKHSLAKDLCERGLQHGRATTVGKSIVGVLVP